MEPHLLSGWLTAAPKFNLLQAWLTAAALPAADAWSEARIFFVAASLEAIGILISIRYAVHITSLINYTITNGGTQQTYGGASNMVRRTLWIAWFGFSTFIVYFGVCIFFTLCFYAFNPKYAPRFGDALLFVLIGTAFGTFTGRFVWRLFGPRFRITEAIIGASVFVLLSIAYSLPVYQKQFGQLFHGLGVASLKTPVGEVTFAEQQKPRPTFGVSANAAQNYSPNAVSRPSDPTPGLRFLRQDTSAKGWEDPRDPGFLDKDKYYIWFFNLKAKDKGEKLINDTVPLLNPLHSLSLCLLDYVDLVPDSRLLAVDVKPVLAYLFRWQTTMTHADAEKSHTHNEQFWKEWEALHDRANALMKYIYDHFGNVPNVSDDCQPLPTPTNHVAPVDENETSLDYPIYLQPYTAIALSSLLMAVGSTDEAVEVLAKWLDGWACARGEPTGDSCTNQRFHALKASQRPPEWLRYRAEFQLNVLLTQLIGVNNIIYRDFIKKHSEGDNGFIKFASDRGVSLDGALKDCDDKSKSDKSVKSNDLEILQPIKISVLQILLDDENSYLLAERNFLLQDELESGQLENLYRRVQRLARFRPECIEPREGEKFAALRDTVWKPNVASYKVTAGLLGVAIADRMRSIADNAYGQRRAEEIVTESATFLREGRDVLMDARDQYPRNAPLSERLFTTFPQEEAYALAGQAIERLNAAGY